MENSPSDEITISLARVELKGGKVERARALFEQALAKSPGSMEALTGIGDAYALAGDYGSARTGYQQAVDSAGTASERVGALLRLSEAFVWTREYARAEQVMLEAAELARTVDDPALEYSAVLRMNVLHRWTRSFDKAEQELAEMLRIARHPALPETTRRTIELGTLQYGAVLEAERGNAEGALRQAEEFFRRREARGLPPNRPLTLGLIAAYLGRWSEAAEILEQAPERETMAYVRYYIGLAYETLGDTDRARAYFQSVANWNDLSTPRDQFGVPIVRDLAKQKLKTAQPKGSK